VSEYIINTQIITKISKISFGTLRTFKEAANTIINVISSKNEKNKKKFSKTLDNKSAASKKVIIDEIVINLDIH
jgi:hypothetical protein